MERGGLSFEELMTEQEELFAPELAATLKITKLQDPENVFFELSFSQRSSALVVDLELTLTQIILLHSKVIRGISVNMELKYSRDDPRFGHQGFTIRYESGENAVSFHQFSIYPPDITLWIDREIFAQILNSILFAHKQRKLDNMSSANIYENGTVEVQWKK